MKTIFSSINNLILGAILTGLLLALSWPPIPLSFLVLIAFVPLFIVEEKVIALSKSKFSYFGAVFIAMLIWHLSSLRWFISMSYKNAIMVSIINSLLIASFLFIPHILKRKGKQKLGHLAFVCFWVSLELLHVSWDFAFPLFSLGNAFGMFPSLIQWYEWTGVMGGSIWILAVNILLFECVKKILQEKKINKNLRANILTFSLVVLVPLLFSIIRFVSYNEKGKSVEVVVIHPNINCHTEKYNWSVEQLKERYLQCTSQEISETTDYILWPENAFPNTEWITSVNKFPLFQALKDSLGEYPKAKLITGGISYDLYSKKGKPDKLPVNVSYSPAVNQSYYTYNAAFQLDPRQSSIQSRSKQQLVPIEESIPYPNIFGFIRDISGSFGGYTFSAKKQKKHVFRASDGTKSIPLICYESAFGSSTAKYVQQGAEVLFVLLNEGWYRHDQGAQQLLYLSAIRAIETRRSIARSSNDGISAFINQKGVIIDQVGSYNPTAIKQNLILNKKKTIYVYFKDILAQIAAFVAFFLAIYTFILKEK